jgi:hypothetical protein
MSADFNHIRPFRFWCQKVLPLVYDDSLSYYELLNKVVKYLNDVIEDVNALGTAFQALEDSLNHYVEDVVEERLDQMVEDGTLDDIVSEVLDDKFDEYTATTDARISSLSSTVSNHTTRLNDHGTRLYNIESTLATSMVTLPHINATSINAENQFTKNSVTAWLRYVSSHYGESLNARPFMGKYTASITMLIIGFAYHFTNLIDGLPDYSEFIILAWGGSRLYTFGTNNGVVYLKATQALTDYTDPSSLTVIDIGDTSGHSLNGGDNGSSTDEYTGDNTDEQEATPVEEEAEAEEVPEEEVEEAPEEEAEEAIEEESSVEANEEPSKEVNEEPAVEESNEEASDESDEPPVEHPDTEGMEL